MTFWYVESQKPELVGAGININGVALDFDFHTTPYRIINCVGQTRLAGICPRLDRPKKLSPLEELFVHIPSRRDIFLPANPLY